MYFIVVLLVLIVVQYWGSGAPLHHDDWFDDWQDRIVRYTGLQSLSIPHVLISITIPLLLALLLELLLKDVVYGLLTLIFHMVALLYGLGRGDLNLELTSYFVSSRQGELEQSTQFAEKIVNTGQPENKRTDSPDMAAVRDAIFYRTFERLFVVIFWYLLLGPVGVVAYRLLSLYLHRSFSQSDIEQEASADQAQIQKVFDYMEWPASRLLGLGFALIGGFGQTIAVWRDNLNVVVSSADHLCRSGLAALNQTEESEPTLEEIESVQSLFTRSVVLWLAIIALLQLL